MDIKRTIKYSQSMLKIDKLREIQVAPINSILKGHDTMVISPTSAGKSAIYQIPALLFPNLTLVIEPTLSLIYDQTKKLQELQIDAAYIDSSTNFEELRRILKRCRKGKIKFLFITPERLQNGYFRKEIVYIPISMVVVDEAHCVCPWGYGFREDYLKIGSFTASLPNPIVTVALTATAPIHMRSEICKLLSMNQPKIFVNSLQRKNLRFITRCCTSQIEKVKELKRLLKKHKSGSCIVYCSTINMTDKIYKIIQEWYPGQVVKCHSNLAKKERKDSEELFFRGYCTIMVATSAFGMGIDQSDVDLVIHFNLPLSLVDYYQQAGRAGRAGQKSKCVLLYCGDDYEIGKTILDNNRNENFKLEMLRSLDQMKEYAESTECLTQQLLAALSEKTEAPCGTCTNCQRRRKKHV